MVSFSSSFLFSCIFGKLIIEKFLFSGAFDTSKCHLKVKAVFLFSCAVGVLIAVINGSTNTSIFRFSNEMQVLYRKDHDRDTNGNF